MRNSSSPRLSVLTPFPPAKTRRISHFRVPWDWRSSFAGLPKLIQRAEKGVNFSGDCFRVPERRNIEKCLQQKSGASVCMAVGAARLAVPTAVGQYYRVPVFGSFAN